MRKELGSHEELLAEGGKLAVSGFANRVTYFDLARRKQPHILQSADPNARETYTNIALSGDKRLLAYIEDGELNIRGHGYDSARQFYIIRLQTGVSGQITINIKFQSVLNDLLAGFYRSVYLDEGEERIIASTQFQVNLSHRVDETFCGI